ncbi:MAG: alpha-1,2-fucosyltransferase [Eubacteriales bacterium]|nr:alpha-1,2-fucosyltransferase [Eubacteriales bacterium]
MNDDIKIVKLKGGLGNQMFQYAFAKLIEKRTGKKVYLDYSAYNSLKNDNIRVPRIEKFAITLESADREVLKRVCRLRHKGNSRSFGYKVGIFLEGKINPRYFIEPDRAFIEPNDIIGKTYFDGYWQSWRYIEEVKDEIFREYIPKSPISEKTAKTKTVMENENSVFVGVRRGDYLKEFSHYSAFDSSYYERAMQYIDEHVKNPVYYVFSNDIEWCKENINWGEHTVKFREPEFQVNDFEEFILMSSCKHAIIVNSTYNWWGAYMIKYPEKIVLAPSKWFFDNSPIDIIPPEWIKI